MNQVNKTRWVTTSTALDKIADDVNTVAMYYSADNPIREVVSRWKAQRLTESLTIIVELDPKYIEIIRNNYLGSFIAWQETWDGEKWMAHGAYPSYLESYYYPKVDMADMAESNQIKSKDTPILIRANQLINGDRRQDYGHPAKNFSDIAKMWSVILNKEIDPRQVALCMIALKACRVANSLDHADTWLDIAGYVGCVELIGEGIPNVQSQEKS